MPNDLKVDLSALHASYLRMEDEREAARKMPGDYNGYNKFKAAQDLFLVEATKIAMEAGHA
jgi:hypothetical protein